MEYLYQVSLKSILTLENGLKETGSGYNLVSITLVYPREGVKSVETIKKFKLKPGKENQLKNISFSEKLLFKESIQGDSSIVVKLTSLEKVQKIDTIINSAVKAGVIAGIASLSGGLGITLLATTTKTITSSLFDFSKPKDKLNVIGYKEFPFNNEIKEGELILNLSVPKKLVLKERLRKDGKEVIQTKTLKKGMGIAQLKLYIKKIPKYNIAVQTLA